MVSGAMDKKVDRQKNHPLTSLCLNLFYYPELMMPLVELEEDPIRGFWMGGEKVDNRWQWTDGTNGSYFGFIC